MIAREIPRRVSSPLLLATALAGVVAGLAGLANQAASLRGERDAKLDLVERLAARTSRLSPASGAMASTIDLVATSETLAAATLDARLRQLAQAQTLTIVETRPETVRDSDGTKIDRVSVHAVVQGRITQVQGLFYALESGQPRTLIDDVEITDAADDTAVSDDPQISASFSASARWHLP